MGHIQAQSREVMTLFAVKNSDLIRSGGMEGVAWEGRWGGKKSILLTIFSSRKIQQNQSSLILYLR